MAFTYLKVDNVTYPNVHILSLKRSGDILDGDKAGRAKSGLMIRDIIGTYYNYTLEIGTDELGLQEYDNLYEVLTSPIEYHTIEMPYGQGIITFRAYVSQVTDELKIINTSGTKWGNMAFKFVAMKPYRR